MINEKGNLSRLRHAGLRAPGASPHMALKVTTRRRKRR
jgi:hypothetical protein